MLREIINERFWLCFVPLFVAVDAVGVLPIFFTLTEGFDKTALRRTIYMSVTTAMIVALSFLFLGKALIRFLGITISDFAIAGGILLFVISTNEMLSMNKRIRRIEPEVVGFVPIGVPLIAGPAVLTTILLLLNEYGMTMTVIATVLNVLIAGLVFMLSGVIIKIIGKNGARTVSRIANLLLAAIAVMMIRKGIFMLINHL